MSEERQNQHMYSLLKNKKFLIQVTERLFILLLLLGLLLLLFLLFFVCLFVLWRFVRELWDRFNGSWGRKQKKKKQLQRIMQSYRMKVESRKRELLSWESHECRKQCRKELKRKYSKYYEILLWYQMFL